MKQIRKGVFETNSSSTHSICISKAPVTPGKFIHFYIGEYGWEVDERDAKDYLYTAILERGDWKDTLQKLKDILDKYQIEYKFEEPEWNKNGTYLENGYIDHSYEAQEFVDTVLADEDLLMRCLFGDSTVYTGNDNDCEQDNMCWCAYSPITDYSTYKSIPNPNHDVEHYDYFFKGN